MIQVTAFGVTNESPTHISIRTEGGVGCIGCFSDELLHTCGHCCSCCVCTTCVQCLSLLKERVCGQCHKCKSCCVCIFCSKCEALINGNICSMCNGCSHCCTLNSQNHTTINQYRNTVLLDRYLPTEGELTGNASPRLLAAEIEVCGTTRSMPGNKAINTVIHNWCASIVHDGSLPSGGFEINTHPAGGDYWAKQCREIYTALGQAKAFFDSRAGCHIHVDARDLGYCNVANLLQMYYYLEPALYQLIAKERRDNTYCVKCATAYEEALALVRPKMAKASETRKMILYRHAILGSLYLTKTEVNATKNIPKGFLNGLKGSKNAGPRYRGLNLHSWIHRGTIEFRFPGHQPSAFDLINMGSLLANLIDLSKRSEADIQALIKDTKKEFSLNPLLASIALLTETAPSKVIVDWIKERIKFYNSRSEMVTTTLT